MDVIPPENLSVKLLAEIIDPYRTLANITRQDDLDLSRSTDGITHRMVQTCIDENALMGKCFSVEKLESAAAEEWTLLDHAARIAWLVVNGWEDPIELDFGIPSLGYSWYPLLDGHHRLAAAIFRQDPWIPANCSGSMDEIERFRWTNHDIDPQGNQSPWDTTP